MVSLDTPGFIHTVGIVRRMNSLHADLQIDETPKRRME